MSTPTPNAHSNSVPRIRRSCISAGWSVIGLAHRAARKEYQQIDRQIAEHQQRDGRAGQDAGAERHDAHHLRERRLIDLISDVSRTISVRRSVRVHRFAPGECQLTSAILNSA